MTVSFKQHKTTHLIKSGKVKGHIVAMVIIVHAQCTKIKSHFVNILINIPYSIESLHEMQLLVDTLIGSLAMVRGYT